MQRFHTDNPTRYRILLQDFSTSVGMLLSCHGKVVLRCQEKEANELKKVTQPWSSEYHYVIHEKKVSIVNIIAFATSHPYSSCGVILILHEAAATNI